MGTAVLSTKVTKRLQTTLPRAVEAALGLEPGESRVGYIIDGSSVTLVNAATLEDHEDPAIDPFLAFLGNDLVTHPDRLRPLPASLLALAAETRARVHIDHDAPITGAIAL